MWAHRLLTPGFRINVSRENYHIITRIDWIFLRLLYFMFNADSGNHDLYAHTEQNNYKKQQQSQKKKNKKKTSPKTTIQSFKLQKIQH